MNFSPLLAALPPCPPGICDTWCTCGSPLPTSTSGLIVNPALDPTVGTGEGLTILQIFITNFITIAFGIGAIVLVFMLISGGVRYIAAGSDKDAVQHASKQLTHALIGITILLSVYAVIALIGGIFGINILQINFPTL